MSEPANGIGLQDILPLSPVQQMHFLHDRSERAGGIAQLILNFEGPLEAATLRVAAGSVLRRHANLRAAFTDRDISRPVQVIPHDVPLPWTEVEFSEEDAARHASADRSHRFDLMRPPLLRFVLAHSAADRHQLILTYHQILLDGRSAAILAAELFVHYRAGGFDETLPQPVPYRSYLHWLVRQDHQAAETAWRDALAGLDRPTLAVRRHRRSTTGTPRQVRLELDEATSRQLTLLARSLVVTVNTLFQAAWGVVLSGRTGSNDVAFGQAVSGRSPDLPGVEDMIGAFLGVLPVRVRIRRDDTLARLVRRLQGEQAELLPHHHLGGTGIQAAGRAERFDTVMVLEDDAFGPGRFRGSPGGLQITGFEAHDSFALPLAFVVVPGARLSLRIHYRSALLTKAEATALLAGVARFLKAAVTDPGRPLASLAPPTIASTPTEPNEIEELLKLHPFVAQAFVVAGEDL